MNFTKLQPTPLTNIPEIVIIRERTTNKNGISLRYVEAMAQPEGEKEIFFSFLDNDNKFSKGCKYEIEARIRLATNKKDGKTYKNYKVWDLNLIRQLI